MAEGRDVTTCNQCGSLAEDEDQFCGTCGAPLPPDTPYAAPAQEETSAVVPPPQNIVARSGRRRVLTWTAAVGLLLVLITGTGAVAYAAFGPGMDLLGRSNSQPSKEYVSSANPETTQEPTSATASVSPDAPPDPAFDRILPTLVQKTRVPIFLPAELPDELENVAIDQDFRGQGYSIPFMREPPDGVEERFGRTTAYGALSASPAEESKSSEYFEATKVEQVELPDGTEAALRYMEPVKDKAGTQGPFWEGKFDKGAATYVLTISSDDISEDAVRQALSTIVSVPQGDPSNGARTTPNSSGNPARTTESPSSKQQEEQQRQADEIQQQREADELFEKLPKDPPKNTRP